MLSCSSILCINFVPSSFLYGRFHGIGVHNLQTSHFLNREKDIYTLIFSLSECLCVRYFKLEDNQKSIAKIVHSERQHSHYSKMMTLTSKMTSKP